MEEQISYLTETFMRSQYNNLLSPIYIVPTTRARFIHKHHLFGLDWIIFGGALLFSDWLTLVLVPGITLLLAKFKLDDHSFQSKPEK